MALQRSMHKRNKYNDNPPNFKLLAEKYSEFKEHVIITKSGKYTLNFNDKESLRALTRTLLLHDFGLDVKLLKDHLIPRVPLRLNYLLWIEDNLKLNKISESKIRGIDIGCGCCCIYPLLGAKLYQWSFVATDIDLLSVEYAKLNVTTNNLTNSIKVHHVRKEDPVFQILDRDSDGAISYDFCLCNPPFHKSNDSSDEDAINPEVGARDELCTEGGEVEFLRGMIKESVLLKDTVRFYTSMLGKKCNVKTVIAILHQHGIDDGNITYTELCQGNIIRWAVGWTFDNTFHLMPRPDKKRRKPLVVSVRCNDVREVIRKCQNIMEEQLKIGVCVETENEEVTEDTEERWKLHITENTWVGYRQKRRLAQGFAKPKKQRTEDDTLHNGAAADTGTSAQVGGTVSSVNSLANTSSPEASSPSVNLPTSSPQASGSSDITRSQPPHKSLSVISRDTPMLCKVVITRDKDERDGVCIKFDLTDDSPVTNRELLGQLVQYVKNRLTEVFHG